MHIAGGICRLYATFLSYWKKFEARSSPEEQNNTPNIIIWQKSRRLKKFNVKKCLWTHKQRCDTAPYLLAKIISQQQLQIKLHEGAIRSLFDINAHFAKGRKQPAGW
jgi:hypothetical protein